jgi:glycosyltransferase involved in cell wall biosynthesis
VAAAARLHPFDYRDLDLQQHVGGRLRVVDAAIGRSPTSIRPLEPIISVIVPVRNSSQLPFLLRALDRQTLPRDQFEVVIADDGSTEPPVGFATTDEHVRVLPGPAANSYAARNRAVANSKGTILAFTDGDCVPDPQWLESGLAALGSDDVIAGRVRFVVPARRTVWTLIDMDTSKNHAVLVSLGVAETANLFVRRHRFDHVGGFDSAVTEHGDYDFVSRCVQSGAHLRYLAEACVSHPTRQRASKVLRAHWAYSRGYAERMAVRRQPVDGLKLRAWIPVVSVFRARRRAGSGLTPANRWLAENGVQPTWAERLLSLPLIYIALPYFRNVAQVVGAARGARRRSQRRARTSSPGE